MRRVLIGTAGHIDHGKTRLVEALTGIDCDRWAAEKERGITIDLGFAHRQEEELELGFIDVPGHEKFLDNALAGLGGIRIMLLVVAADEGVKPQTREHLAICSLLEIEHGIVALTKSDLVDDETLELATLELEDELQGTAFESARILPVSSLNGDGIDDLLEEIRSQALNLSPEETTSLPTRLPIDRAFHLKGLGVVVTGTLAAGSVEPGTELTIAPGSTQVRVRNVQVHGSNVDRAVAGQRTALQLTGAPLEGLPRGAQLVEEGAYGSSRRLLAEIEWLASCPDPMDGTTPIRFHLFSSEIVGRARPLDGEIEPGQRGIIEIQLSRPIVAVRGDRFVLRRPSPGTTLGGGIVLDPQYRQRRGTAAKAAIAALRAEHDDALVAWVEQAREAGVESPELARRLGQPIANIESALAELASEQKIIKTPTGKGHGHRWLTPKTIRTVADRAERFLTEHFRVERLAIGIPKAEAIEKILPGRGAELSSVYFAWLAAEGVLTVDGDLVNLPGRETTMTDGETELAQRIVEAFDSADLAPGSPPEIARSLGAKPQIFDGLVEHLIDREKLVRLPGGLIVGADAVDRLNDSLESADWENFTVADFKERFGLTRKWAIPLLEHLDSRGSTRRVGDKRQIVRGSRA